MVQKKMYLFKEIKRMRRFTLCCIAALAALLLTACTATETEYEDSHYTLYEVVESSIELESAEDLAKIGDPDYPDYPLNGVYILSADIDLSAWGSWEPIGTSLDPFSGIFDGRGKTIRGLKLSGGGRDYTGLFGRLLNARLTNLTIEADTAVVLVSTIAAGTTATAIAACAGVAAGYIDSSYINSITIRGNVTLARSGAVTGTNEFNVGALAGAIRNSDVSHITVDMNLGAAGAALYAGLIAGRTLTGTMAYCQAEGRLDASSSGALTVGGIVGAHTGPLENCASAASVYAEGLVAMYVGGITGTSSNNVPAISCSLRSDHPVTIQGVSLNTATTAQNVYVGGITGYGSAEQCLVDADAEIIAETSTSGVTHLHAGGIAGMVFAGSDGHVINSFVRRGTVVRAKASATATAAAASVYAGGIAGRIDWDYKIENCFSGADVAAECGLSLSHQSDGVVAAGGVAGGYVGSNITSATITQSGSSGTVSAVSSNSASVAPAFAGGIMGRHAAVSVLTMRQCAALNPQITAESAGTAASAQAYAYRVLGGAFTVASNVITVLSPEDMLTNANLTLGLNYGIPTTETKTQSGAGDWETVPIPEENNSASYMGSNIQELTQDFFETVLGWDFTETWGWDAAANLPYPLTN
jgi:hypothetical protein